MNNIYILELTNNKYYIGRTHNIKKRIQDHIDGSASIWTTKYRYISLINVIKNASIYDENKYTLEYMDKYGIDNVRGGSYSSESLNIEDKNNIYKQIWGANDCCINCGYKGHYINKCHNKKDINGNEIITPPQNIKRSLIFEAEHEAPRETPRMINNNSSIPINKESI
jgi:hypothetical protein